MLDKEKYSIAYLSMEIALESKIKTYAGGLGVLAGDILKSAAGKKFPMVGITLLSSQGYFKQRISKSGQQIELIDRDYDFSHLKKIAVHATIKIGQDLVKVGVWCYIIKGANGFNIPIYFLDTNILGNKRIYKKLSTNLYGGNQEFRLRQEIVLGRGGVKILELLGYKNIKKYHLNEGHGALAAIELFNRLKEKTNSEKIKVVKKQCVFTTHTPIQTVFDEFPLEMVLKNQSDFPLDLPGLIKNKKIKPLDLGLYFGGYINGVSKMHQKFLIKAFSKYNIKAVTNGVNSVFWTAPEFKKIYDKYLPGWREDGRLLKAAEQIDSLIIWRAHQKEKDRLLKYLKDNKINEWRADIFTLGYARRFTEYKQPLLLFSNLERLLEVFKNGQLQIILAGKAHPHDLSGQAAIKKIYSIKKKYPQLKIIFLENYNLEIAQLLVSGVDLWLNTPRVSQEASGTSGMKAAHNGVPQISTLDGWWLEGYKKNKTGWVIEGAEDLYRILEIEVLPLYYQSPEKWQEMMRNVISLNAAYFNTDRVLDQYINEAYK